jgi:hypothetical protein
VCPAFFFRAKAQPEAARQEPSVGTAGMAKTRVSVYIDGFNLYHSTLQHTHPDCRWLNLWELSERIINPKTEEITAVNYFSALTTWIPERAKKHLLYIHALRTVG